MKYLITISYLFSISACLLAQSEFNSLSRVNSNTNWLIFSDAKNSTYNHLSAQAFSLLEKRSSDMSKIKTLAEWQKKQESIRKALFEIVGTFPPKTPLNARVLRRVEKGTYRIEHIVFESQPGFYVTSSMFIPGSLQNNVKAPAIIYCSGHWLEGYHNPGSQQEIINLVNKGFIVIAFDPVGQGERIEYFNPETGKSSVGGATSEHTYPGVQALIAGSSQAYFMIWDGIRVVDYLISRKEVNPAEIGITGCSGGGTQTAYIAAVDNRIKAAAPQCYITNFTRLLQSIGPQDAEQNLPGAILKGIDHPDLLLVRAPKPAFILSTTEDFFNIQGARETYKHVSDIYRLYGKGGDIGMADDFGPHGSTKKTREALYAFFQKYLNNPGDPADKEIEALTPEEMRVTSQGQVSLSYGSQTVYSLNLRNAEILVNNLETSRMDLKKHLPAAVGAAKRISGYKVPAGIEAPVLNGRINKSDYVIEKCFIKGEGDYVIPFLQFKPTKPASKVLIYLNSLGKSAEAIEGGDLEWFARNGFIVIAPDLLGIGETGQGSSISTGMWYMSILIGRSLTGIHAGDISRLVKMIQQTTGISAIYALSTNELAPALLHSAAFNKNIMRVALIMPSSSYRSIVVNRFYNSALVPYTVAGSLRSYDLPDLAASIAPRKLLMIGTKGAGTTGGQEDISKDLSLISASYKLANAADQLRIVPMEPSGKIDEYLLEWIK